MGKLTQPERRAIILDAAINVANGLGIGALTALEVSRRCAVPTSRSTVTAYYATMEELRRDVVSDPRASEATKRAAVTMGILEPA